jgi:hypothetical protein
MCQVRENLASANSFLRGVMAALGYLEPDPQPPVPPKPAPRAAIPPRPPTPGMSFPVPKPPKK